MVFSVVIYYTFVTLKYSTEIQEVLESSSNFSSIFLQASIILILFVAVFILYSNAFFTKKRKKEIGLYSLLGVRKKTIGKMLFYENFIMGVIAIIIGVALGTFLSKLFTMILLKLMGATIDVGMTISFEAILNTFLVFGLIFLVTSIRGYRLIYRFKLIELFHAEKEGEHVPKASIVPTVLAIIFILSSYYLLRQPLISNTQFFINLLLITFGLVVGTYLLFRFVTVFLLKAIQKNKSHYYKGMNLIGTSQLMYRIQGNARTLTIISLLSAVTLSVISTAYSMYYFNEVRVNEFSPFSYVHQSIDEGIDQEIKTIIESDKEHPIEAQLDIQVIELETDFKAPGEYLASPTKIISTSTFNRSVKALNKEDSIKLSNDQTAVIKPRLTEQTLSDYKGKEINLPTVNKSFTFVDMKNISILPWTYPDFYIVVNDEVFQEVAKQTTPFNYKAYMVENHKTTETTAKTLMNLSVAEKAKMTTYYKEYKEGVELSGLNLFLLGFLGLVFLAATGSMIYFKQLTEAHSDVGRYVILRKLGVSKREVTATIAKQSLFVLALPLTVGILHSSMILEGVKRLYGASYYDLSVPMFTAMVAYVIIYLGYYVLTVYNYNSIVNK
jgi:putative ABC transport system permease protein